MSTHCDKQALTVTSIMPQPASGKAGAGPCDCEAHDCTGTLSHLQSWDRQGGQQQAEAATVNARLCLGADAAAGPPLPLLFPESGLG